MAQQQADAQAALVCEFQQAMTTSHLTSSRRGEGDNHPAWPVRGTWLPFNMLSREDNVEAFLEIFERVAEAAQCPRAQWLVVLGPYLMGDAQAAVKALSKEDAADYDRTKTAIFDRYTISPETHRQRL